MELLANQTIVTRFARRGLIRGEFRDTLFITMVIAMYIKTDSTYV